MKFTIEITENELKECLLEVIKKKLSNEHSLDSRVFKKYYSEVIKEMIYEPNLKKEIIDRTVNKAAKEIQRKAMPIITANLFKEDTDSFS